jgi:spermidine synthase
MRLNALVFCAGAGSLATEIAAARLLAPYYGSSTVVWANVIGLVLASLSLGYWLGGRLADRRPSPRVLGVIVLGAAVSIAAVTFAARPLLDLSVEGLDQLSAGAVIGSFFAVLLLFAPAVTLLGMVAPFAIRLAISNVADAGSVAGRLYALSTIGSLLGTFLSALVTIPVIGTQRTLLLSAALVALAGSLLLGPRWLLVAAGIAALLAVPTGAIKPQAGLLHEEESLYQYIQVVQRGDAHRLYLNEGIAVHSVWRADELLTGGVWDTFLALPPLLGRPPERVAILGNAGGTTARAFGRFYPDARIDGVELDGAVSKVGRRYFGLGDNPRLDVHTADARPFLRRTGERYDLIVVDAYRPPYVPFYLATREFFALARDRLKPGGAIALNVATVPGDHRLAEGIARTLRSELPQVVTWQPLRFNQIVIGLDRPTSPAVLRERAGRARGEIRPLGLLLAQGLRESRLRGNAWTDDRAPVEWITDRMIVEFAAGGGRLDEFPLPTAP